MTNRQSGNWDRFLGKFRVRRHSSSIGCKLRKSLPVTARSNSLFEARFVASRSLANRAGAGYKRRECLSCHMSIA
jgi:hypothetical protein